MSGRVARSLRAPLLTAVVWAFGLMAGCSEDAGKDPGGEASAKPSASYSSDPIPGLSVDALTPRERRELKEQLHEVLAPCPNVPVDIATCIREKRDCKACLPAAEFLRSQVQAGRPKKDRAEAYSNRFDPAKVKDIAADGSPSKGPDDATVTIVEWADFECPFCRLISPLMDYYVRRFPGDVRVIFKFYPLKSHANGEIAARAGAAAHEQGKFWKMHDMMFANQGKLARSDLEAMAGELELEMDVFKKALTGDAVGERIAKDVKVADGLGLDGTPMLYINGREVALEQLANPFQDLEAWIALEIEMAGKTPAPLSEELKKELEAAEAGMAPPEPEGSAVPAAGSAAPAAGSAAPAAGSAAPAAGSAAPAAGSAAPKPPSAPPKPANK